MSVKENVKPAAIAAPGSFYGSNKRIAMIITTSGTSSNSDTRNKIPCIKVYNTPASEASAHSVPLRILNGYP